MGWWLPKLLAEIKAHMAVTGVGFGGFLKKILVDMAVAILALELLLSIY